MSRDISPPASEFARRRSRAGEDTGEIASEFKVTTLFGPFVLLVFYVCVIFFIYRVLPRPEMLLGILIDLYKQYGYAIVLIGAFLEGLFLVGMYVPGSTVVLLGAALSKTGVLSFPITIGLGVAGLVAGYIVNYFLGTCTLQAHRFCQLLRE